MLAMLPRSLLPLAGPGSLTGHGVAVPVNRIGVEAI